MIIFLKINLKNISEESFYDDEFSELTKKPDDEFLKALK